MGQKRFIRMNTLGNKLSKIDRILVSQHVVDLWPNSYTITLPRDFSDHCPLLLSNLGADYGPIPFKLYTVLHTKTSHLLSITVGITCKRKERSASLALRNKIDTLDAKAETEQSKNSLGIRRSRNSRFFHGMISSRRNRSRINGLNIQREWVLDLMSIKNHIFEYFDKRFKEVNRARPSFTKQFFKQTILYDELTLKGVDSLLSWSFLLSIMEQIRLERGLRQGFPLSLFLFIIAAEALNMVILEATNNNLFHGIKMGKDKVYISHLNYDDALILGEWSISNAKNLSRILTCFHLASGLKVNFNKSKIFSIGVSYKELNIIAFSLGCLASQFPCTYLGLPVGAKMSRCRSLEPFIKRFQNRLSKWKANTLLFRGRLTLIKSVLGSLSVYYPSTFKAPKKVIHKLEGIRRRFFWGGNSDVDKISWVAWDKVVLL
ncbi:putative RNA-directed DNA polymerase, eukaryota, reverse transcriptase zinc-binding domain protein [Tanacetum coccineum]